MSEESQTLIPPREDRPKRKPSVDKMVIEYRRMLVAQKYLRGQSMDKIAQEMPPELACSRSSVYRDLQALREIWRKEANLPIADMRAKELAKIDELERTAWEAYEISKGDKIVSRFGTVLPATTAGTKPSVTGAHTRTITKSTAGNPRFLEMIEKCINRRCEILGLKRQTTLDPMADMPILGISFIVRKPQEPKQIEATQLDSMEPSNDGENEPTA